MVTKEYSQKSSDVRIPAAKMQCEGKNCPIESALDMIGKKWSLNIIRDLFMGRRRFRDFLQSNKDLSTKMLSERLKELEGYGLIKKDIVSTSPVVIEYSLTDKGRKLDKILYEVAAFCIESAEKHPPEQRKKYLQEIKKGLGLE